MVKPKEASHLCCDLRLIEVSRSGYYKWLKRKGTLNRYERDNAVIESLFGRFKDVLRSYFQYWKCDDIQKIIDNTLQYFNYIKPLRKLQRKPPVQYRLELVA